MQLKWWIKVKIYNPDLNDSDNFELIEEKKIAFFLRYINFIWKMEVKEQTPKVDGTYYGRIVTKTRLETFLIWKEVFLQNF